MLIAGTITTVSVYGQSSKSNFVTKNELQAALSNLVTQEDLQTVLAEMINSANTYFVEGPSASFGSGNRIPITSTAECDEGDIVLEGGYSISTQPGADIDLSHISTGATSNGEGYFITAAGNNIVIQSNALCFNTP